MRPGYPGWVTTAPDEPLEAGAALRFSRERAGMARADLAAVIGVDEDLVRRWEEQVEPLDHAQFLAAYRATLPPPPPGWDEGQAHDLSLPAADRGASYRDGSRREYWERIDRYAAEIARGGWFGRAARR
jgi:transcriptional regulator with XRE-family HTH domain